MSQILVKGSDGMWVPAGEVNPEKQALLDSKKPCRLTTRCKMLILGALVVTVLTVLLVVSFAQPATVPPPTSKRPFTFDDIFGPLAPSQKSLQWLPADPQGKEAYAKWTDEGLVSYLLPELTSKVLVYYDVLCGPDSPLHCATPKESQARELGQKAEEVRKSLEMSYQSHVPAVDVANYTLAVPFTLSPDLRFILFKTDVETVYRHSTRSTFVIYDTMISGFTSVIKGLNFAVWSPSTEIPMFAYVQSNNLFVVDAVTQEITQVTTTGEINQVINGMCDWVSEEEVFSRSEALWWSPDGMYLAFLRFDESNVAEINFPVYSLPDDEPYVYKYPKAGQNISVVSLSVYSVATNTTIDIDPATIHLDKDGYIVEVAWFGDATVACKVMPRLQNEWVLWSINATTGASTKILNASHPQYLDYNTMYYLPTTNEFVDLTIENGFNHLAVFSAATGNRTRLLTQGEWEVQSILALHPAGWVFYTSTALAPNQQGVFAVSLNAEAPEAPIQVSCGTQLGGPRWDTASFSFNRNFFVLHAYGESAPGSLLCAVDVQTGLNFSTVSMVTNNTDVLDNLSTFALPHREFVSIPGVPTGGNRTMRGQFLYPSDYVSGDCSRKFPVLIKVYGGPGAQEVTSKFPMGSGSPGFHTYLSSSHNFLIFTMDPVGTGGMGDDYRKAHTYGHLGVTEAEDVLGAVDWLKQKCFVSHHQIALWGWSFGGFMASRITSLGARSGLAATIAVAPVTDWRLYDTAYTERFMRTPAQNQIGYDNSSVLERASLFTNDGPRFFLVHGTGDDNVHFQNSALLVERLVGSNPTYEFSSFYYPNRAHGLTGPNGETNQHLYRMLARFLLQTLQLSGTV